MENDHLKPLKAMIIRHPNTLYCYRGLREDAERITYIDSESEKVKTIKVSKIKSNVFDQLNEIIPDREMLLRMEQITHRMNDWDGETKIKLLVMLKKLIELT